MTDTDDVLFLEKKDIESSITERSPFFKIWRAIFCPSRKILFSETEITENECRGHFPKKLAVPLIRISERMAQTGLLLIGALSRDICREERKMPIAIAHGEGKALTQELLRPPLTLVIKTELIKSKLGIYVVDAHAYSTTGSPVAELKGIKYIFINSNSN